MDENEMVVCSLLEELCFNEDIILMVFSKNTSQNIKTLSITLKPDMPPRLFRTESWLEVYDDYQFYRLFRMRKRTFFKFVDALRQKDTKKNRYTGGHHPINIEGQVLIFIWYMATQDTLLSIGITFKVCPTTVMKVINRVLYFTNMLKSVTIRQPLTEDDLQAVADGFNFPGVVGALDGSHIFLKVEEEHQDSYIDRYRRRSINLMAICDSNRLLLYIFVGFPGSGHDARVFQSSNLYRNIERLGHQRYFRDQFHFIADTAFTLRHWVMTPFRGNNLNRVQSYYNECLSNNRIVIEHCFGILKGRWRRIQFINTYTIFKGIEITTAACVLHNFCLLNQDDWEELYVEPDDFVPEDNGRENFDARAKRNEIAYFLFNNRN